MRICGKSAKIIKESRGLVYVPKNSLSSAERCKRKIGILNLSIVSVPRHNDLTGG